MARATNWYLIPFHTIFLSLTMRHRSFISLYLLASALLITLYLS